MLPFCNMPSAPSTRRTVPAESRKLLSHKGLSRLEEVLSESLVYRLLFTPATTTMVIDLREPKSMKRQLLNQPAALLLLVAIITISTNVPAVHAAEEVAVQLKSGRWFAGFVDSKTTHEKLVPTI